MSRFEVQVGKQRAKQLVEGDHVEMLTGIEATGIKFVPGR